MNYPAASSGVPLKALNAPRGGVLNPGYTIKRLAEIEVRLIDVNSFSRYSAGIGSEGLTVEEVKLWRNW